MAPLSDLYELSPTQQELLLYSISFPQSRLYLRQIRFELTGDLAPAALFRAAQTAVDRHAALRTGFLWGAASKPLQAVYASAALSGAEGDLRALPPEKRQAAAREWIAARRHTGSAGFDLGRPPLFALDLLRTGDGAWTMLWTYHHLILDGWSLSLLLGEILRGYVAESVQGAGRAAPTPPLPPGYRAYIDWLQRQNPAASEAYWRRLLAGFTAPTRLGNDRRPEPGRGYRGHEASPQELEIALPASVAEELAGRARQSRLTLNTLAEGAWALLLHRYSGEPEVVFGVTVSGRPPALPAAEAILGPFVNRVPGRQAFSSAEPAFTALRRLQEQRLDQRLHEHCPPVQIQGWSAVPPSRPLYESLLVFENYPAAGPGRLPGGLRLAATSSLAEATAHALTLLVAPGQGIRLRLAWDARRFDAPAARRILEHFANLFAALLENPERPLSEVPAWTAAERHQVLFETAPPAWEAEAPGLPVHLAIAARMERHPTTVALVAAGRERTYGELSRLSRRLAGRLQALGVGPEVRVAVYLERGSDLVIALLAVLAAGGAYVPLDPAYPAQHRANVLDDARPAVVVTSRALAGGLPPGTAPLLLLDDTAEAGAPALFREPRVEPESLAYVLYTSGSTGRPKGVEVCHRGLPPLFAALDERFGAGPGVWLAVASVCFDLSVVELLWTLSRGFTVVVAPRAEVSAGPARPEDAALAFSLFYFSSLAEDQGGDRYRLLLEGARFADRHGFAAVWTPERHFHPLGGLFPNPSVIGGALAMVTERIEIRAGSVVLPLHDPLRVAEEWAVVDNLSGGRVGLAFVSGWHAQDFVLAPEAYRDRRAHLLSGIDTVRRLWRGEAVRLPDGTGRPVDVRTFPRPIRPELPVWIATSGDPEIFRLAGALGASVLTHLFGQSVEELAEKIALYRQARRIAGHPGEGRVGAMVHTFLGRDLDGVRETVRRPFYAYLRSSLGLLGGLVKSLGQAADLTRLSEDDMEVLLGHAFDRYFEVNSLLGTPDSCRRLLARLAAAGVGEVACFIDFGLSVEAVLESLALLDEVRREAAPPAALPLPEQLRRHRVTHLQVTPSHADALSRSDDGRSALGSLACLALSGEALPAALAARLAAGGTGALYNLYGPTEATVYVACDRIAPPERGAASGESATDTAARLDTGGAPIGRTLRGSRLLVLDRDLTPVPRGVPGELWLGGPGLARGYLGRPAETALRFAPDPWSGQRGARLYRTGDLVRELPDGRLDFLGRYDKQVKVRGHRVELGAIEAALLSHPAIREALLTARPDPLAGGRLIAYLAAAGEPPDPGELRAFLRDLLPEPMVPAAYVFLPALPRRPNGKIDPGALPDPGGERPLPAATYKAPSGPLELAIAAVWGEVLKVERIGADDSFFDLGGNSLLLFEVHRLLRERAGIDIEMVSLLRFPTLRSLARQLAAPEEAKAAPLAAGRERAAARLASRGRRNPPGEGPPPAGNPAERS